MLSKDEVNAIAMDLFAQHERRQMFEPFPDRVPTVSDAQDIQDALVALFRDKHKTTVGGYKIALSSKQTRDWLKIQEPCAGQILKTRIYTSPHVVKVADYVRFSIEPEVCVVLDRDMNAECTAADVRRNLRSVHCAYELVEDRGADLTRMDAKSLTCDNSWNHGMVIGPPGRIDLDLANRRGRLKVNGVVTQEGTTAETMGGDPLHAAAWLISHMAKRGRTVHAGEPIITGSIVQSQFPVVGDVLVFAMDDMPPVEVRLE